jgi:TP901 family phage tail tape measure protein
MADLSLRVVLEGLDSGLSKTLKSARRELGAVERMRQGTARRGGGSLLMGMDSSAKRQTIANFAAVASQAKAREKEMQGVARAKAREQLQATKALEREQTRSARAAETAARRQQMQFARDARERMRMVKTEERERLRAIRASEVAGRRVRRDRMDRLGAAAGLAGGVGSVMMGAGGAVAGGLGMATRSAIMYEESFRRAASKDDALRGSSPEQLEAMSQRLRDVAADLRVAPVAAAEGFEQLMTAGLDAESAMGKLPLLMKAAAANGVEFSFAADQVSRLANIMHPKDINAAATEYQGLADVLTKISNVSSVGFADLTEGMLKVGPTALQSGLDPGAVAAMMGSLGNIGIQSADAGVAIRNFLLLMTGSETKRAKKAMRDLGITQEEVFGYLKTNDPAGLLEEMGAALDKMSDVKQTQVLGRIFGRENVTSARGLLQSAGTVRNFQQAAKASTGTVDSIFGFVSEGSAADAKKLTAELSELGLKLGTALLPVLTEVSTTLVPIIRDLGEWMKVNPGLTATIVKTATAVSLLSIGFGGVARLGTPVVQTFAQLSKFSGMSTAMGKLVGPMSRLVTPVGALGSGLGLAGPAAGVLGSAIGGWAIGTWIDKTWGLSNAIADLNTNMSVLNGHVGLSEKGGAAFLGDLNWAERHTLKQWEEKRPKLDAELAERDASGWADWQIKGYRAVGIDKGRTREEINAEIQNGQALADNVNRSGLQRGAASRSLQTALEANTPAAVAVKAAQDVANEAQGMAAFVSMERLLRQIQTEGIPVQVTNAIRAKFGMGPGGPGTGQVRGG